MAKNLPDISQIQEGDPTGQTSSFFGSFFLSMGGWSWIILGMLLIVAEIFVPSSFIVWFGLSAVFTGVLALVLPIGWQIQVLIFTVLAIALLLFIRRHLTQRNYDVDQPNINVREEQLKGQRVVVSEEIKNGVGKVSLGDTVWRAKGPETAVGETVVITGMSGASLVVENTD